MRQGLIRLISGKPDIQVIGEAASGQEAIELAQEMMPDVIVIDVSMPERIRTPIQHNRAAPIRGLHLIQRSRHRR